MKSLSRYAFINAKTRARLSRFLKASDWENLKVCIAVDDFRNKLDGTRYESVFGERGSQISLSAYEQALDELLAADYSFVLKNASSAVSDFAELIQLSQQIYLFKRVLRNFIHGDREFTHPLLEVYFGSKIINIDTLEQFADNFRGTFFYQPLFDSISEIKIQKNIFMCEMRLDKAYFKLMWELVETMFKQDKAITSDFLKLKTDVFNIKTIYRLRRYLNMSGGDIEKFLVRPKGEIDKKIVSLLYDEADVMETILSVFGKYIPSAPFGLDTEHQKQNDSFLFQLDIFMNTALIEMAKMFLPKHPFSVSVLWLFFLLSEAEVNNIRCIMRNVIGKHSDNFLSTVLVESGR